MQNDKNKRRRNAQIDVSVYGKIPPQAREIESAILGAIMVEKNAIEKVIENLTSEMFYVETNKIIFEACIQLYRKREPIDILTVSQKLQSLGNLDVVGGPHQIAQLINSVVSGAHIEYHAKLLKEKYIGREVIRVSSEAMQGAFDDEVPIKEVLEKLEEGISKLCLSSATKEYAKIQDVIKELIDVVYKNRESEDDITGVPSGIPALDFVTSGWQPGDLIVIAARPSVGKSAIAGNFARNAALSVVKPTGVGIFSLEMPNVQWALRLLAAHTMIDGRKIIRGKDLTENELQIIGNDGYSGLGAANLVIDDTSGINIWEFRSKCRKMVIQEGVGMIIVDYLQLMDGSGKSGQNREQEISEISRNLKKIAKELCVPIIALSQLSRAPEKTGQQAKLSDLRESGAIEQDADIVIFLEPIDEGLVANDSSLKDTVMLKIAKHRNGELSKIEVKFVRDIQRIMGTQEWNNWRTLF